MRPGLLSITVCAAAIAGAAPARAASYSTIYSFGDSLSDTGNVYAATQPGNPYGLPTQPVSPPYFNGEFSNGPIWLQYLAPALGLPAPTPSLLGGTNFAYGGAETGTTAVHTANQTDLLATNAMGQQIGQLGQFAAAVPHPAANALYTLWIGSNDLADLIAALGTPGIDPTVVTAQILGNISTFVADLAGLGAKNLLVLDVPDLANTPGIAATLTPAEAASISMSIAGFDQALATTLAAQAAAEALNLTFVDTFAPLDAVVADPPAFGFSNATDACYTGSEDGTVPGTVCAPTQAGQNQYLYWDDIHPTTAGQELVAGLADAALPEPGSLALLSGALAVFGFTRQTTSPRRAG